MKVSGSRVTVRTEDLGVLFGKERFHFIGQCSVIYVNFLETPAAQLKFGWMSSRGFTTLQDQWPGVQTMAGNRLLISLTTNITFAVVASPFPIE